MLRHQKQFHYEEIYPHPGAHLGAHERIRAHRGAHKRIRAHVEVSGEHERIGAHIGAHLGAHGGAHLGAQGAHGGAPPLFPPSHTVNIQTSPPPPLPQPSEDSNNAVFQHPFTMMISGPTACGKTTMVSDLLQNHNTKITPNVQRVVWLYKRWQPLYSIIKETVLPRVEFIQGIPTDLEDDDFFNSRINNLLILDDLFSEAGRDKRVTDLFTEGSHHRSLSVISINQNLFGNKDPTQRRNSHYLVLFNNPVDKQSVMTLARQMYPGQSDLFMKQFSKATKYPYGHLLVDLKPFTPENARLKCGSSTKWNAISHVTGEKTINEANLRDTGHLSTSTQTDNIAEEPENMDKGQACDDCGQLFDTTHDVQRHVKNGWCPEHRESKKRPHDDISDSEQEIPVNKARELADESIQPNDEKFFLDIYESLIDRYILPLGNSDMHKKIMSQIDKMISKGHSTTSAVSKVVKKHKKYFEDLFDVALSEESGDETDVSEEEAV
ncbi:hypothetical protein MAR_030398 [Mya arenaria]|uniref:C2H2-type domain-containing protein n=1 Tax=Mya arenaria TaxID=6604 RepID=A0ABY7F3N7_MYAAR|nr:hypothetical protein MAR_030398 [Mya arenaria]